MENLKKLRNELRRNQVHPSIQALLVKTYLETNSDKEAQFVGLIKDMRLPALLRMIDTYIDEMDFVTVEDLIKSQDMCIFEWQHETYQLAGVENGVAKFRKLGSAEIVTPPFGPSDRITRIF